MTDSRLKNFQLTDPRLLTDRFLLLRKSHLLEVKNSGSLNTLTKPQLDGV